LKLEIWMIVGVGIGFAVGLGAIAVLLLGLHAEVRRLSRLAAAAHRSLLGNLEHALDAAQPSPISVLPGRMAPKPEPALALERPGTFAATASSAAVARPAPAPLELVPELTRPIDAAARGVSPASAEPWSPDRRLLVMRLAGRGRNPDQIAAALQIPQEEVEKFLEVNQLVPARQMARLGEGP
jgi:hypothetical protein